MADVQSNIKVSIDTTDALASIKNLQRQISAFHTSMAKGGAAANAVTAQMQQTLINSLNATGKFSAQMRTIKTTTESFTNSLEKNKFTLGEYFRYAGGASKSFGKLFKTEFDTINKVARENVKDLQTQYIKMGRDANGAMRAIAVRPLSLDMNDLATKTMIASEKQALLNQLLKQGSTNLLNFGKNTQWAGRQLMVGFTIPLIAVGSQAAKTFMDMETQAIRFKKVYGDLFTPAAETKAALDGITELGKQFTKYGVAVSSTVGLASEAAAAGFKGLDLQRQTAAATKLSILGQVESSKALETTISLQNAFSMSSEDLAKNIDFLNAVENQTVLSLDDMSTAIPKAAPVIKQLGGDVKDLAFFMTAMKEGGINASEGANALKSGLASMINPTSKASAMLAGFGINVKKIVVDNRGDLKKTVIDFATALNQLDPLNRAQAIEQMFGKFQFARLSTLFQNVTKEGTQASRVLNLAGASVQDLANLSEKELGMTSESAMNKFKASVENLKLSLVPVGEEFLKAVTPIAEFVTKILDKFNNLGDGTKKIIVTLTAVIAGLGPVLLMTFGLLANGIANIIKGFVAMKTIFNKAGQSSATLGTEVKYMTLEQRNAAAVAASLDQVHNTLAQTFTAEAASVDALTRAYLRSIAAQNQFMPTGIPLGRGPIKKRATGKPATVGGTGNQDSELAYLMPGETVIPTKMSKKYGGLINGMIADKIPGYQTGRTAGDSGSIYWTQEKRDQLLNSLGLTGRERVRIPLAGDTPTYSTSGVMAPASVNDTAAGMTSEFIKSPLGRVAYNENIRVGLEDAGISGARISQVFDEVGPTLKDAIDKFDETTGKWSKTAQDAMDKINKNPNITETEKLALRRRIAPLNPEDYTVGSRRVLEVSRRRAVPRAERVNAPARYGSARQLARLKKQFPDADFSGWEYSHMPGQASIPGQQADVAAPTIGTGVKGVRGRALNQKELAMLAEERKMAEARASKSTDDVIKKVKKTAATASPSKRTIPVGEDIARGLAVGMKNQTPKVIAEANKMTDAAINGTKPRRSATRASAAAPIGPAMPSGAMLLPMTTPVAPTMFSRMKGITGNIAGKFAGRGAGMGMAGSAAMMAASFLPGKMGDLAQKIMPLVFGFQALSMALKFLPGPLKLVAVAFAAGYGIMKLYNAAKERERLAIEGLGDAATVSEKKLKTLGDFFGIVPTKLDYLSRNNAPTNAGSTPQQQSAIDSLQQNKQFQKDFKNDIASLKKATTKQAKVVFDSIAVQLRGSGFAPEQIDLVVKALQEEAGKTKIKFDFANIDLSTDLGLSNFDKNFNTLLKELDNGVTQTFTKFKSFSGKTGQWTSGIVTNISDAAKVNLKLASDAATGFINGLSGQLRNGTISADQFSQGFARISSAIEKMPKPEQLLILKSIMSTMPADIQKGVKGLKDFSDKMLIIQAQSLGFAGNMAQVIAAMNALDSKSSTGFNAASRLAKSRAVVEAFKNDLEQLKKAFGITSQDGSQFNPYQNPLTGGSGAKAENPYLKILQKEIDALKAKRDAQKDANDEVQREIDLKMKLQDLANQATQAKISGNYLQAAMLGQEAQNAQMAFNKETELKKKDAQIAALEARYNAIKDGATLTAAEKAKIPKKAGGGLIKGPGSGRSDSIRASLGYAGGGSIRVSNGEFVVKSASVSQYGIGKMNAINNGTADVNTNSGGTVYNINMPITSNNASASGVADEVMRRLKVELNKNNKSNAVRI
jgi:TP901 family phage tail tape measure protein